MPSQPAQAPTFEIPHTWEEPQGLHELLTFIREQRPNADVRRIRYAYYIAEEAHSGQSRGTGDPYIIHPLAVAHVLAELHMDDDTICAALLHDVLEDCPQVSPETIQASFGETVLMLVEGVTKLKFSPQTGSDRQRAAAETARVAETLRKMLLAMARDPRVMVIKLADRLHNLQTLEGLPPDKRTRIANETLDIYAPLAARLGIWQVKWQLEDLAFKHLHPKEFQEISERVAKTRSSREKELQESIVMLKEQLASRGVREVEVYGRPKHLYSIFNKIVKQNFKFEEILDLLAMRVIVPSRADCYLALGIVHDIWMPIPGLFSDYIAKPKPNGYQSLHTKVVGPHGEPLEVQIRTREMHEIAEYGVAAHFAYKEGAETASQDDRQMAQLREQLFDWSSDSRTSSDFMRSVTTDLFAEQVFVFTPKGDVLDLPMESTPIDFAFRVHSSLGLTVIGSKINGVMVPLSTRLKNGDVVELITRSNAQPSLDWLEFVKSNHARSKIRAYFRKRNRGENESRGKEVLEKELKALGLDPREYLGEEKLNAIAQSVKDCENSLDVLAKVGEGLVTVHSVVAKLRGMTQTPQTPLDRIQTSKTREGKVVLVSTGIDNMMIKRGKCCEPVPGEEVVGYTSRGRGIIIHRKVCPNATNLLQTEPDRLVPLEWPPDQSVYAVHLRIVTLNRQGLLLDITTIFAESRTNVVEARIRTLPNSTAEIEIGIEVADVSQLNVNMVKISNLSDVISILRSFEKKGS